MRDSRTRGFEHLRNLENLPIAEERASDILRHWGLYYAPGADLRGPGEWRIHRHADGETADTVGIKLGVFVQHLLKAREAGTRKPDSCALGAIAPRPREGGREPRSYPPGTTTPLTRYMPEGQAGEILEALGDDVLTPEEVWTQPPGRTREAYRIELADKMRYLLGRSSEDDVDVLWQRLVMVSGPRVRRERQVYPVSWFTPAMWRTLLVHGP